MEKKIYLNIFLLITISTLLSVETFSQKKPLADSTRSNSLASPDSTVRKKKRETLIPVQIPSLLEKSINENMLSKKYFDNTDYRYAADFFTNIPFGFVRDLGSLGQPYEVKLNGNGFGNTSFLSDGILLNNRLSNSFDLNHFQSESIEALELIPLSMGFLFNNTNDPVVANFVTRQYNSPKPFSRIKFYQAPNSEGMIDGSFCVRPFSRLSASFEITNQTVDSNYTNTDLSNWLGSAKINYIISNELNVLASYKYFKTITRLNGGVDINRIEEEYSASQVNSILYDNIQAPVRFENRYEKASGHNFDIHLIGELYKNSFTDFAFYYQSYLTEYRQNENDNAADYQNNAASIIDDNKSKTFGVKLRHDFSFDIVNIRALANYERNKYVSPLLNNDVTQNVFSIAGVLSAKLIDSTFEPKIFAKYLNHSDKKYFGYGAHAGMILNNNFQVSAGFSSFEKPYSVYEENLILSGINHDKKKLSMLELSGEYLSHSLNAKVSFFSQASSNSFLSAIKRDSLISDRVIYYGVKDINLQGINLFLNFSFWKILFYANTSYYFNDGNRKDYDVPEFTSAGGIYYVDTLFERNLKLKTGFKYYSVGPQNYSMIDFETHVTSTNSWNPVDQTVSPISESLISTSFQVDFFLAGRIRDAATVYFVFQNIFNEQYYIMPYYPKQQRGLRFGVTWEFLD